MAAIYKQSGIAELITSALGFMPTEGQIVAINSLSNFIIHFREETGFVLKGYAGTGKTTLVGALVKILPLLRISPILMAPTGRAAKVLSRYAAQEAYTIHKFIYYAGLDENGSFKMNLRKNQFRNTLFVVDEASMLGVEGSLLRDLFTYVYSGYQCRLLFLGDGAQLPPVGSTKSPAIDADWLGISFNKNFISAELIQVLRQENTSEILSNATELRLRLISDNFALPMFKPGKDLIHLKGEDFEDTLQREYSTRSREEIVFITRSNKRANLFNNSIRNRVFCLEEELSAGDLLMLVKNNYYWAADLEKVGFIANGDIIEVLKVIRYEERYGFRFADVEIRFTDYISEPNIEVKVCLDCLHVDGPSLSFSQYKQLWDAVSEDYSHIRLKSERMSAIKNDPFLNALQVKYAYALTCHKTQGGQWPIIFVDLGYFKEEMLNEEFLRWMYTALTRGMERVYLVGFDDDWIDVE